MKKILALALALMLVLSLAACGGGKTDPAPSGGGSTTDPGTTQQQPDNQSGGSSQKADGAQMDAATDNANSYTDVQTLSGLSAIGKPAGYKYKGSGEAGETRNILFAPETDTFTADNFESYAAAIWNLCIDTAKDGEIIKYSNLKVYETISEARKENPDSNLIGYVWYYSLNGNFTKLQLTQNTENGEIKLLVEPYGADER